MYRFYIYNHIYIHILDLVSLFLLGFKNLRVLCGLKHVLLVGLKGVWCLDIRSGESYTRPKIQRLIWAKKKKKK